MGEMNRTTFGRDVDHDERMDVQAEIQDVLDELQREMAGDSVDDVVVAINRRLADDGIPEQPHRWVQAMAERISAGRPAVADTAAAVDAVRLAGSGGHDDTALVESEAVETGPGIGVVTGAPQDADGSPAPEPTEMTGGPADPSVEPGSIAESEATPPPANPR
jgi:hypothetical protein